MNAPEPIPFKTEGPQPLLREIPQGEPYPVEALGPLRAVVEAVQDITQAPVGIAAQSALSVASLAVQGFADVEASGAPSMSPAVASPSKPQRWHQDKVPSSWALAELRPWQLEVNEMIQEPTNNTGIWLFDSQTYPGRGKGTFFKHLIATTDDVFYEGTPSSFNVEAKQIQFAIDYIRDVSKQTRAMCYRLPRADPHNACFYEGLGAVAPETHVVVAGSFWPDLRLLPNRRWRLFEWDDENNIHELPPGTDPGGRVGVGNTNSEGDYIPYWNRGPL